MPDPEVICLLRDTSMREIRHRTQGRKEHAKSIHWLAHYLRGTRDKGMTFQPDPFLGLVRILTAEPTLSPSVDDGIPFGCRYSSRREHRITHVEEFGMATLADYFSAARYDVLPISRCIVVEADRTFTKKKVSSMRRVSCK